MSGAVAQARSSGARFPLTLDELLIRVAHNRRAELELLRRAEAMIQTECNTAYADDRDVDGKAWSEAGFLCRVRIDELRREEAKACAPWFEVRQ